MSALLSLSLSHFRSHKQTEIQLDERPVVIFGPNGVGKTNILEAVSLFSPGRGMRRASADDMGRRPEDLGWKLSADIRTFHQRHHIETWSDAGAPRNLQIDGKVARQLDLGRITPILWLVPAMDRLWTESAEGRRRFLDRVSLSFFPEHAAATLKYDKSLRQRNQLLRDNVRDSHWFEALEQPLAESGMHIHNARCNALEYLVEAQSDGITAFPTAILSLTQREGEIPNSIDDLRTALIESRGQDRAAGRTLVGPHRTDLSVTYASKDLPARHCSTGEQKALLLAIILANLRALKKKSGLAPILLLDEVAAHLDAERRESLYQEVCKTNSQTWMTGTERTLFVDLADQAQYFEVSAQEGESQVRIARENA
ncbi:MAG: DNA replication/repair protein RecF [Aestuariivita sp.]|nr:DNA replication/repair protein RecF [Aestuariivita sp.]MCY4201262.1 DNA replication/repair protein RecF [Aestuariivita sp.]MCY4288370.1 DNA replication/repair protein RecF [Aestuariivita sp.]MCY4346384.1 DNA replication/repair protein RecF [Aestuariivita sp.]